jgi:outer membrane protein assembly factor BamB
MLVSLAWFLAFPAFAQNHSQDAPELIVTPSTLTLLVGDPAFLSANDATGRPVKADEWSISAPIADLQIANGDLIVEPKHKGRAVLTARFGNLSATAVITVLEAEKLPAGSVEWSIDPTPGFEALLARPASMAKGSFVDFYLIEWSKTSPSIVRAFRNSGQQLWSVHLRASASPTTLKHTLPDIGEIFLNETRINNLSELFARDSRTSYINAPTPDSFGLPADGKRMIVREGGGGGGDLLILERGRFRDSLVSLSPTDGSEAWRFDSPGRLGQDWTVRYNGDIGITETQVGPVSSALLVINGTTGIVSHRIPIPESSTTINGTRCKDPVPSVLKNIRASRAGAIFTSADGSMNLQIEKHIESVDIEACVEKQYSFDNVLYLLRVSPEGEATWKVFQEIHADGDGRFQVQSRLFAGETIPDGFGGVLAAWTHLFPGSKDGEKPRFEARLSRISDSDQRDFTLPMPTWTAGANTFFDEAMVLGDDNVLFATNKQILLKFDVKAGEMKWVRQAPTGQVDLQFASAGGGVILSNAGQLWYFDANGYGQPIPSTVAVSNPKDIGLIQSDPLDGSPLPPLKLRAVQFYSAGQFFGVEDGGADGRGSVVFFSLQ